MMYQLLRVRASSLFNSEFAESDTVEKLIEKLSEQTEKSGGGLKTAIITGVASIIGGLIVGGS